MRTISLIAAIDEAGGLGKNNQLLCHLSADLQHFKKITMGKPVIMGRKTFQSIGKALPGRLNIVISRSFLAVEGVTVVNSLTEALEKTGDSPDIMIIGGEMIFSQAMDFATRLYITRIHHVFDADVFFPPIDADQWLCQEQIDREKDEKNPFDMTFCIYAKKS